MFDMILTLEERIFINAGSNDGLQKSRQDILQNLKLMYEIVNDDIKEDVRPLIKRIEEMSEEEFYKLTTELPFDTEILEDTLHEEITDTFEVE